MVVRGAPAIDVSAAYGIALGAKQFVGTTVEDLEDDLDYICDVLAATRPTAVNLFWAIDRMKRTFQKAKTEGKSVSEIKEILKTDAIAIHDEDIVIFVVDIAPVVKNRCLTQPREVTQLPRREKQSDLFLNFAQGRCDR